MQACRSQHRPVSKQRCPRVASPACDSERRRASSGSAGPGSAYHLAWSDNRPLAAVRSWDAPERGQVMFDPVFVRACHDVFAATEAPMPGMLPRVASRPAAQLVFFDGTRRAAASRSPCRPARARGSTGPVGGARGGARRKRARGSAPRRRLVPLTVEHVDIIRCDAGAPLVAFFRATSPP